MNMRDFWAAEAAKMRDTSHLGIGTKIEDDDQNGSTFSENVIKSANRIFKNVQFGSNSIRNSQQLFDTRYWVADGAVKLKMKAKVLPSTALKSLMDNTNGKLVMDCAQFVQVAYLGAIMLTDGELAFNKLIGQNFIIYSFNSTKVETEILYSRINQDEKFTIFDNPNNRTPLSQEQLLENAPIGSRITVANFRINEYEEKDATPAQRSFATAIRLRGWANENMIKIGNDSYAAFGISAKATLTQVRNTLVNENYRGQQPTQAAKEALLQKIQVSHVEHFKRK